MLQDPRIQRLSAGARLARHRHAHAYAALVLEGGYLESGDQGRRRLKAGELAVHGAHEAHLDVVDDAGARVLNIETPIGLAPGFYQVAALDEILRASADGTAQDLAGLVRTRAVRTSAIEEDWPDLLAAELVRDPQARLAGWADRMGLKATDLAPGFTRAFGVTPKRFRAEAKSRRAAGLLAAGQDPLAEIAVAAGLADQAHMNRAVLALTGLTPGAIRNRAARTASRVGFGQHDAPLLDTTVDGYPQAHL